MNHRPFPLLLFLLILCLGGVWLLTWNQGPALMQEHSKASSMSNRVEVANGPAIPIVKRVGLSLPMELSEVASAASESNGITVQLVRAGEISIAGWQLAMVPFADGSVVEALSSSDQAGMAFFPLLEPGRYALEGALLGQAAFRIQLVMNGEKLVKVPLYLTSHTNLNFQNPGAGTPLPQVQCYLEASHLFVAESNAAGDVTLMTQRAELQFEKESYSTSYVFETAGRGEVVFLRPEIEVRVELAREWSEYSGSAAAVFEKVLEPITDFAGFYADPQPEPEPFDYLHYQNRFNFESRSMTSVKVPAGSSLTLTVQKGGAVVSLKTSELTAGQIIFVPAPEPSSSLQLYLRNSSGELVQGELRAINKGNGKVLPVSWQQDHWQIAQPESCAHFEIKVKGCAGVWCWQKQEAFSFGGFLEIQLAQEHTFFGFLEGEKNKRPLPTHVSLSPAEYRDGSQIHAGWISKTPGAFMLIVEQRGEFQIDGLPAGLFFVRVKPAAQTGGFGKVLGDVLLPQEVPFVVPRESMQHFGVRCVDTVSFEPILEFAATNQRLGLSTESQMGLWQGWAEEGDVFVFRAIGYQPLEISMPLQGTSQLELEMQASAPMTLRISGLSDDELASYSFLRFSLMRMVGADLFTQSFTRDIAIHGRSMEAYFPADGEWVVISLRKPDGLSLSAKSRPFKWEAGGNAVVEF